MKTKADVREYFLNVIDEATKKGVDLSESKNADYRVKFDTFLDTAQKYVASTIKIADVYQVTQNPIGNMGGYGAGFDIVQVLPGTDKVFTFTGCKSFYVEMDNVGTCTVAINGSVTDTISNTDKKEFTAYKRLTGASSTDTVVITFTGSYPFNIRNTGFFEYAFPLEADVPEYTPYVTYDMPSDFLEFDAIILKADPELYNSYVQHKWENTKKVVFHYEDAGSFDIHYFKYPTTIDSDAADTTELEVSDKAFELVALQCGVMATAADNTALSSWLRSLYIEKIQNISQSERPIMNQVQTVYTMV